MPATAHNKWIIILVAHDDASLEPQVLKERIPATADEHLAAFLRGGELLATLPAEDSESEAESLRRQFEKDCLR